ncbi:MAG: cation:proton antiporter, partial [Chloroflexi bacterium]|nr:cation:proton antiporter [Chloroflexota bacterium]
MDEPLIVSLVLAVVAAIVGGVVAQRLKQPVIIGYLVAGFVIGPFSPGPTADVRSIQLLAEIGVIFLMFSLGAEFSFHELRHLRRIAMIGGPLQILCTSALGLVLVPLMGLSYSQAVFVGGMLALSSTVVALKVLVSRGELQALHGRVALGILIAQDLAVVPMVVVLPALAAPEPRGVLVDLGMSALKAGGVLVAAYLVGSRLVPWLLAHTAGPRSRELFLLSVVGVALGTALATQRLGLSPAFGAFLAGLVVAESEYRAQALADSLPLRDLFAALFFVSIGMLIDPAVLISQAGPIGLLTTLIVLGKGAIVVVVVLVLGMPGRVAIPAGLSLAQIGEFSFVLARIGADAGAIPASLVDLVLATALVSIVVSPLLIRSAPYVAVFAERVPGLRAFFREPAEMDTLPGKILGHTIIAGFGHVGSELAKELEARGMVYTVIDYNPLAQLPQFHAQGVFVLSVKRGKIYTTFCESSCAEAAVIGAAAAGSPAV